MRAVPKVTAMRQTKERRKTYLSARAVEMAGSGKYRDWEQIEFALCFDEGYLEARGWLDSRPRREWLTSSAEKRRTCLAEAKQVQRPRSQRADRTGCGAVGRRIGIERR